MVGYCFLFFTSLSSNRVVKSFSGSGPVKRPLKAIIYKTYSNATLITPHDSETDVKTRRNNVSRKKLVRDPTGSTLYKSTFCTSVFFILTMVLCLVLPPDGTKVPTFSSCFIENSL